MIRIVTVDDSHVVLRSLALLIGASEGIELAGQARSADEPLELVRAVEPEVVLMDFNMPGMDGHAYHSPSLSAHQMYTAERLC